MFGPGPSRVGRGDVTSRFASNVLTLLTGSFLLTAALGFRNPVTGWLDFAMGCLVTVTVLWGFAFRGRGRAQRVLDAATLLVGVWSIVASRAFPVASVKWLTFAEGALLITISLIGLIVHEVLVEMALSDHEAGAHGRGAIVQQRMPVPTGDGR